MLGAPNQRLFLDNAQGLGTTDAAHNCHTTKPSGLKGLGVMTGHGRPAEGSPVSSKPGLKRAVQEPLPGFSLKYLSNLSASRSNASASAGGSPFTVMFGQILA